MSYLITMKEAAELLGYSADSFRKYYKKHGIPYIKIGRRVRFRVQTIEAYIEKIEKESE